MAHSQNHIVVKSTGQAASSQQLTAPSMASPNLKTDSDLVVLTTTTRHSEKHEKMIKALTSKISTLHCEISKTEALLSEAQAKLNPPNTKGTDTNTAAPKDPAAIVQRHIRLLHEYNEIKDIGQGLIGLIAEARGVRHVDVQRNFGVGDGD